jgi:hypothetical protein
MILLRSAESVFSNVPSDPTHDDVEALRDIGGFSPMQHDPQQHENLCSHACGLAFTACVRWHRKQKYGCTVICEWFEPILPFFFISAIQLILVHEPMQTKKKPEIDFFPF